MVRIQTSMVQEIRNYDNFASRYHLTEIVIDKSKWHYLDSEIKDEPVLVMLHGTRGNPFIFWKQFNILETKLRLIAIKLPLSHDAKQISDGLLELMQHLSISNFNLLGTSIGGYIAQWFTYYYPRHINKLFICNSIIDGSDINNPSWFFSKYVLPGIPYFLIKKKFLKEVSRCDEIYLDLQNYIYRNIVSGLSSRELSERALTFHTNGRVPDLEFPDHNIIIIDSNDDPYISKKGRKKILDKYPNAVHKAFNKGHHFPYIVQPKKFNDIILQKTFML